MFAPFLQYAKQSINEEDIQAVAEAMKGKTITRGSHVAAFEKALSEYCKCQYAVAFNSGTAALMAAYFAARVTIFDRVISTPNSFIATVGYPLQLGNYPHFIDIDRTTGNMDLNAIEEELAFRSTRGKLVIVPVHFAGIAVDMCALYRLIRLHPEAVVIEDAAHALGSYYPTGEKVGSCSWSQMTIFSFHPAKTLTTGEGGMVMTNDPELCHRLQLYRNNGIEKEPPYIKKVRAPGHYEVHAVTGNFNVTDLQAALGLSQLRRVDEFIKKRRHLMQLYRERLQGLSSLRLFTDQYDAHTAFHLCVVQIDFDQLGLSREEVMRKLEEKGIGTQVHYIPLYRHPILTQLKEGQEAFYPEMERYYAQALSLPLYYDLREKDIDRICKALKEVLSIHQP